MQSDFRYVGIFPNEVTEPKPVERAWVPMYQVIPQLLFTAFICGMTAFGVVVMLRSQQYLLAASICGIVTFIVFAACKDAYLWIEVDRETIRGRHFYLGFLTEARISDVEELRTILMPATREGRITGKLLGRIRAYKVSFKNQKRQLTIFRADPAMKNAEELVRALLYHMKSQGQIEVECDDVNGKRLIRRIVLQASVD